MYNIIFNHYLYFGHGYEHFPRYKRQLSLTHCFTDWHNDSFILISGIVGYKTNKYSNLFYLWLTVFFYSVGVHKYILYYEKGYVINVDMDKEYYPIIFTNYWYFTTYFAMYLFLPVINTGISYLSKYDLRLVIMSTLGVLILWKDYKNPKDDIFFMSGGNSPLWFIVYYLTGAYIGKYRINYVGIKKYIYCFICLFIFVFTSYVYFKAFHNELYYFKGNRKIELPIEFKKMLNERQNSSLKIIQSITICLFFMQINYNIYIAKFISFFGPLVFGVYLSHSHKLIFHNVISRVFRNQPSNLSLNSILSFLLNKSFMTLVFCLFIDYLRHLLFTILRIKKISFFIEPNVKEKLS